MQGARSSRAARHQVLDGNDEGDCLQLRIAALPSTWVLSGGT
jgi:hypothetical protein